MQINFVPNRALNYKKIIDKIDGKLVHYEERDPNKRCFFVRHDEDWALEYSLDLARAEHRLGIRATYFLNHSAAYFDYSPQLADACKEIEALGHRIGLHNNAVEEFLQTGKSVVDSIGPPLDFLRSHGISVQSCSSHGSKVCRENRLLNFEIWAEFEGSELAILKTSPQFDGVLGCPRVPLSAFGLLYDCSLVAHDCYISDSSGRMWGFFRHRNNYADRIYDLSEFAEILRSPTVIKNNVNEIVSFFNTSLDAGLLQILFHPKFWQTRHDEPETAAAVGKRPAKRPGGGPGIKPQKA